MNWFEERPKQNGWYWVRGWGEISPYYIAYHADEDETWVYETENNTQIWDGHSLKFAGPINYPKV